MFTQRKLHKIFRTQNATQHLSCTISLGFFEIFRSIQYATVCRLMKVGTNGLSINQQWAMTAHISCHCQTLSKCRLNARLLSPDYIRAFVPLHSVWHNNTIFPLLFPFAWLYCLVMLLLIPRLTFSIEKIRQRYNGSYLPFVIFMWLSNNYTQQMEIVWKRKKIIVNCLHAFALAHTLGNCGCSTVKMSMATDLYFLNFFAYIHINQNSLLLWHSLTLSVK